MCWRLLQIAYQACSGGVASTWIPGLHFVPPGMTRLLVVPAPTLVIPAQAGIHSARVTLEVPSDIGRYRQHVDPGSTPGMTELLPSGTVLRCYSFGYHLITLLLTPLLDKGTRLRSFHHKSEVRPLLNTEGADVPY